MNNIKLPKPKEVSVHRLVTRYLKHRYPSIIFRTDFAAGIKLSKYQSIHHKDLQSGRAYPDLFIAEPRNGYFGLYIELKREGVVIWNKDGTMRKDDHIQEQYKMLLKLESKGYKAVFAIGFEEAKKVIDDYLKPICK